MNNVNMIGRITGEIALKYTPTGTAVAMCNIAIDRPYSKEVKAERLAKGLAVADFPRIKVFGKTAENLATYQKKGSLISLTGSFSTENYTDANGEKKYYSCVIASNIQYLGKPKQEEGNNDDGFIIPEDFPDDENIPF